MFKFFKIEIEQKDFRRYINALSRMEETVEREVYDRQQMRSAVDYQHRLSAAILSQKYAASYSPYSRTYAMWKKRRTSVFPGYWLLSGSLLRSIRAMKLDNESWYAGVQPGATGERGRPIAVYGAAGEYADVRKGQPARPVFRPTAEDYAKDPEGWTKRGMETLRKVRNAWR